MARVGLLGALLAGFALRLYQLGTESLWYDETVSVVLARKSVPDLIAHTAGDIHPPGYYLLLHFWHELTQPSLTHGLEFLFTWPSLCFGMLTLALVYAVGRRLLNAQVALLTIWLGVVNPFHLWYSQEVRMYTLGAALGLLCLWSVIVYWQLPAPNEQMTIPNSRPRVYPLITYLLAAAAGLYVLYYFLFSIAALNLIAVWSAWQRQRADKSARRLLGGWLLAQLGVLLLWAPWLPTFVRQITNPPVPPWRVPWSTFSQFIHSLAEGTLALFLGQSFFEAYSWLWLVALALTLLLFFSYIRATPASAGAGYILTLYVFAPIVAIYLLTATVTPLYHVRYLFTYAPLFLLLLAGALLWLRRIHSRAPWPFALIFVGASLLGLQRFWFDPAYRADDHRAAVAQLAAQWRPGDAILVNAGWAYTALQTYWPAQPPLSVQWADPAASLPPPLGAPQRLTEYIVGSAQGHPDRSQEAPQLIVSGSVDGDANLGWGSPTSDFYAISQRQTAQAIAHVAARYPRIWHYRLYDTVSDPTGEIRTLLAQHASQSSDAPYAGRDFLRVQLYTSSTTPPVATTDSLDFDNALRLVAYDAPAALQAGHTAYTTLYWHSLPAVGSLGSDLSMSLRLYDADEQLLSQQDAAPGQPTSSWTPAAVMRQPLAIGVPIAAKAGRYSLELIVYRQDDGAPLAVPESERTLFGQRLRLATLDLTPSEVAPVFGPPQAIFDYIALLQSQLNRAQAAPGDALELTLYWQPRPSPYSDSYNADIRLIDANGDTVQTWLEPLGGASYPSGAWPALRPVRDVKQVTLRGDLPPGRYHMALHLQRAADGFPITANRGWLTTTAADAQVGSLEIQ